MAVIVLAGIAMLAASMTAWAAGNGIVNGYDVIYQSMVTEEEEIMLSPEFIEYVETEVNPQIRVEMDDILATSMDDTSIIT